MDKLPSLEEGVGKLKLSDTKAHKTKTGPKKKSPPVVDSWEDEMASSSSDDDELEPNDGSNRATPAQPNARQESSVPRNQNALAQPSAEHFGPLQSSERDSSAITKRPEKSTAAIRRMLAGSLGMKISASEETKKFERAQVANERKKREDESRRVQEEREARRSVWED